MQDFEYLEPRTINEAVSLLDRHKESVKVMAGGTDLVIRMIMGTRKPSYIIDLKAVPGLAYIDCGEVIRIGATTTMQSIAKSPELKRVCPQIVQVAEQFASITVGNMATLGGNLCNASPGADTPAPLIVLSARVKIAGPGGTRTIPVEEFFTGPGSTVMKPNEILTEVQIPLPPANVRWGYIKFGIRSISDLAVVSVATLVGIDNGRFNSARIALGSVAPTPLRAKKAEQALIGNTSSEKNIDEAARLVMEECCPISDVRASADYRRQMSYVLTKRALLSCLNTEVGG
jgi:carbon-monoxide dehydrogenase medium subunit